MSRPVLALTGPTGGLGNQDEQVLVDALPYFDTEFNEADRQMALSLIKQECKVYRETKNYLKHLPVPDYDIFLTPTMLKEHARMNKKEDMAKLDMSRCDLPCPSGRNADKDQWKKAIKNARTQNEHLVFRQINLELMNDYSAEALLRRNKGLENELTAAETKLRNEKEEVMEIHAHRKRTQTDAGRQLSELEQNWVSMIANNYKMEMAINHLEEVTAPKAKKYHIED